MHWPVGSSIWRNWLDGSVWKVMGVKRADNKVFASPLSVDGPLQTVGINTWRVLFIEMAEPTDEDYEVMIEQDKPKTLQKRPVL